MQGVPSSLFFLIKMNKKKKKKGGGKARVFKIAHVLEMLETLKKKKI